MASTHKHCSVGPLPSDEEASTDRGNTDMEDRANQEEGGEDGGDAHSSADSMSVMFPPCQDPLLVNIYRGLPALQCVASLGYGNVCES